jgi:hypothetical protein
MSARIIVHLMRDIEHLRDENGRLLIAVRGFETEPQSPFPLLSGEEVIRLLHPSEPYRRRPCRSR